MKCLICNDVFTIMNYETGLLETCECVPEEHINIDLNNVDLDEGDD